MPVLLAVKQTEHIISFWLWPREIEFKSHRMFLGVFRFRDYRLKIWFLQ